MKAIDKINSATGPFWSFEFFPPKTDEGVKNLYVRLEHMARLGPAFVDVTWGAGGSTAGLTMDISTRAQEQIGLETMMHLTCTNMPQTLIQEALAHAKQAGIRNILALRGDAPAGTKSWRKCEGGFGHAIDLVRYIRREFGDWFGICVAGYPEGHPDSMDPSADLIHLKEKVDAGADFIITQLFYDVDRFIHFVESARSIGINCPIIPGMMPIQNYSSFIKMTSFCKTAIPSAILDRLVAIKDDNEAVKKYGVELAVEMCTKLMRSGVRGVHFYTMNQEAGVKAIMERLGLIDKGEREVPGQAGDA